MVCRVCKKELDGAICSFCGEDNTPYMNDDKNEILNDASSVADDRISETKKSDNKAKKRSTSRRTYKYDKKKLTRFIIVFLLIILAIIIVSSLLSNKKDKDNEITPDTMFSSGMLSVSSNGLWGYVNKDNPSIFAISPQFAHVSNYYNDRAAVYIDGRFTLIDKQGNLMCDPIFDSIGEFSPNGYIAAEQDGKWGYISRNGNVLIPTEYYYCGKPYEDIVVVGNNGQYGYMKMDGTSQRMRPYPTR